MKVKGPIEYIYVATLKFKDNIKHREGDFLFISKQGKAFILSQDLNQEWYVQHTDYKVANNFFNRG
jgi:hypothetical protein